MKHGRSLDIKKSLSARRKPKLRFSAGIAFALLLLLLLLPLLILLAGCGKPALPDPSSALGQAFDAEVTFEREGLTATLAVHFGEVSSGASPETRDAELLFLAPDSLKGLTVTRKASGEFFETLGSLTSPSRSPDRYREVLSLFSPGEIAGRETREEQGVPVLICRFSDGRLLYCDPSTGAIRKIRKDGIVLTVRWFETRAEG